MRVLIIDDNFAISEMLSKYFQSKGYDTEVINNPTKAVNQIIKGKFDFVILDILMPNVSGIEIINALEQKNALQNQKIILLSSLDLTSSQTSSLLEKDGIQNFFKKPVRLSQINLK
jgi:DNA-binding response OmpR family regulator